MENWSTVHKLNNRPAFSRGSRGGREKPNLTQTAALKSVLREPQGEQNYRFCGINSYVWVNPG